MECSVIKKPSKKELFVLNLIARYDYITSDNLIHLIANPSNRTRFIRKMESEKYVHCHTLSPRKNIWYLTNEGKVILRDQKESLDYSFTIDDFDEVTMNHTSGLANIEMRYLQRKAENIYCKKYYCEKELYSKFNSSELTKNGSIYARIPDAMFEFYIAKRDKIFNMAIELELNMKSKKRYFGIFHFYRDYMTINRVYWICKDDGLKRRLVDIFTSLYQRSKNELNLNISGNEERLVRARELNYFIDYKTFMNEGFSSAKNIADI